MLNFEHGSLAEVRNRFQEAGNSRAAAEVKCTQEEKNQKTWEGELETLLKQQATNRAEIEELLAAKAEALKQVQRNWESAASMVDEGDVLTSEGTSERLKREHDDQDNVQRWLELEQAWLEATSNTSAMESGRQLLRAANLICATTVAIGSHPMISGTKNEKGERKAGEWSEFDTLIVDEASRVTDAEFLIGAVRSRRWILVGDEHQLPPYVEQDEEHFLHALVALRMVEQGDAPDAKSAVAQLESWWEEDEELRQFRRKSVLKQVAALLDLTSPDDLNSLEKCIETVRNENRYEAGSWKRNYRALTKEIADSVEMVGDKDSHRELMRLMIQYMIRSLFERCLVEIGSESRLCQKLVVQRRMLGSLAELVREPIYLGNYSSPDGEDLRDHGLVSFGFNRFIREVRVWNDEGRRV